MQDPRARGYWRLTLRALGVAAEQNCRGSRSEILTTLRMVSRKGESSDGDKAGIDKASGGASPASDGQQ